MRQSYQYKSGTITAFCVVMVLGLVLISSTACHKKDVKLHVDAIENRGEMPIMDSQEIITLISDSGIIRYRIKTASWQIFDKAEPSYWEFPKGVFLEKFDPDLNVEATLRANYAKYLDQAQLWELRGNVDATNKDNERFETPLLYWDQEQQRVYSDSAITITKEESIIHGIGFESNQEMTKYIIKHPTGIIPIKDADEE